MATVLVFVCWIGVLVAIERVSGRAFVFKTFVQSQFIFVGLGLALWPRAIEEYIEWFPTFRLETIRESDVVMANVIVLVGVCLSSLVYAALRPYCCPGIAREEARGTASGGGTTALMSTIQVYVVVAAVAIAIVFIKSHTADFLHLAVASEVADLGDALASRREATSNYLSIVTVYNLVPALAVAFLVRYLQGRKRRDALMAILLSALASVALVLTFQKRPLLIFLIAVSLAYGLYRVRRREIGLSSPLRIAMAYKRVLLFLFSLLTLLYYFYIPTFRFSEVPLYEALGQSAAAAFSRIFGRLSLPAAMYTNYYPRVEEFYGFRNVGLYASMIGQEAYPDSKQVFDYFTMTDLDGRVANSAFIDLYCANGWLSLVLGAIALAGVFLWIERSQRYVRSGAALTHHMISGFMFAYYLSQTSMFRAALGYGGLIYFAVWWLFFGRDGDHGGVRESRRGPL
jgi:hypothetical protein